MIAAPVLIISIVRDHPCGPPRGERGDLWFTHHCECQSNLLRLKPFPRRVHLTFSVRLQWMVEHTRFRERPGRKVEPRPATCPPEPLFLFRVATAKHHLMRQMIRIAGPRELRELREVYLKFTSRAIRDTIPSVSGIWFCKCGSRTRSS